MSDYEHPQTYLYLAGGDPSISCPWPNDYSGSGKIFQSLLSEVTIKVNRDKRFNPCFKREEGVDIKAIK
tara:strand:- start:423 stop:629 length:207 start_codon:yes stop_codon:yes gene_type:complete